MTLISITRTETDGFETVHAKNGALALSLIPALGGKLNSLRDLGNGREWLWRNPRMPYQRVPHLTSYITHADTGGWDECFPSVARCEYPSAPWQGAAIQDHGEIWSQEAELKVEESAERVVMHTRVAGIALPYLFERAIVIQAASQYAPHKERVVRFEYRVTNTGSAPMDWIWSSHPLLAIEPGMQLLVPSAARFHVGGAFPAGLLAQTSGIHFPLKAGTFDLTTLPERTAGLAMKLWSEPLKEGWATLNAMDGELRMRWDATLLPQLGIWMNLGAWAGEGGAPYYNLGLEPCIGAQDSLADAVSRYGMFETLLPNAQRAWWLEVELVSIDPEE